MLVPSVYRPLLLLPALLTGVAYAQGSSDGLPGSLTDSGSFPTSTSATDSSSTSTSDSSTSTSSTLTSPPPPGWTKVGCYQDANNTRALSSYSTTSTSLTVASCQGICSGQSYTFAGVEFATQCYCGNSIAASSAPIVESNCGMTCSGDPTQTCGGIFAVEIYSLSSTGSPTSTTSSTSTSSTDTPTSSTSAPPSQTPKSSHKSNAGAIAGGIVGGLAVIGILLGAFFLYRRRRRANERYPRGVAPAGDDGHQPPSPRLRNSWIGSVARVSANIRKPHAQRLGSVGGESIAPTGAVSEDGHQVGGSEFSYRNASGSVTAGVDATAFGTAPLNRHRSSGSRASRTSRTSYHGGAAAVDDSQGGHSKRASYDLSVFRSNSNSAPTRSRGVSASVSRQPSDPFGSNDGHSTAATVTAVGGGSSNEGASGPGPAPAPAPAAVVTDLSRGPSTSRLLRKPAPKYDGEEPQTPVTPITPTSPAATSPRSSKPPVSGHFRQRTHSGSSSMRVQAAQAAAAANLPAPGIDAASNAPSSSRNSFETAHDVQRKGSHGTLGGAFRFAGEKEGPVHYLIPDPPPASAR